MNSRAIAPDWLVGIERHGLDVADVQPGPVIIAIGAGRGEVAERDLLAIDGLHFEQDPVLNLAVG